MKKKIFIFIILFLLSQFLFLTSCKKDFLDTPPTTAVSRADYIVNLQTSGTFLNGIYIDLSTNFFHSYGYIYPDLVADNIKPVVGSSVFNNHYKWLQVANDTRAITPSSSYLNMNAFWTAGYKIIRACDYLLENIDRFKQEDPTKANNFKGQAYAIRALAHFGLVNVFAQSYKFTADASHPGIPYVTSSDYTQSTRRYTVAEVYSNIVSDLSNALQLIDPSNGNVLNMNLNAARALLSRVYLFKGDYENAKNLAVLVNKAVPIMLSNYPAKLFTPQETEALFQLPPGTSTSLYNTTFSSIYFRNPVQFLATNDIASILTERSGDSRKAWVTFSTNNWNITKFPSGAVSGVSNASGAYYLTVLRSSETFLTASECYAKLGKEDSARIYLDSVRRRADATVISTIATGSALLDSIYKERRKEFAFENIRIFDLLRNGQSVHRTDALDPGVKDLIYPNPKFIAPIPSEDVSYYSLIQNPGY